MKTVTSDEVDAVEQARRWLTERGVMPESVDVGAGPSRRGDLGPGGDPDTNHGAESGTDIDTDPSELEAGSEADPAESEPGPEADPEGVARTIALRQLTVRARTRHELATALARRQVPSDAAETVLDRLDEVGLVDDAQFARDWVASRQARRHLSRTALRRELRAKGVDRDVIDEAVATTTVDEREVARDLARRKARSMAGLDPVVQVRRLAGMLTRRGFSASVVADALADVGTDEQATERMNLE